MPIRMNPAHDIKNPAGTRKLADYINHVQKQEEIDNTLAKAIKRPSEGFKHPWEGVGRTNAPGSLVEAYNWGYEDGKLSTLSPRARAEIEYYSNKT